jgi:DNA repair protein RadC
MQNYATSRVLKVIESYNDFKAVKITNSSDSYHFIQQFYSDDIEIFESFFIVLLNRANETIGWAKISQGGVAGTIADPIIIAKYAIDTLSSSVILAHNHPSGNLNPSQADINLTINVQDGLKLFNVRVLDHLILTKNSYYSLKDNNNF